jgi:hypothetical protein
MRRRQGISVVEPVVPSLEIATGVGGPAQRYFWPNTTRTFFKRTALNSSRAAARALCVVARCSWRYGAASSVWLVQILSSTLRSQVPSSHELA